MPIEMLGEMVEYALEHRASQKLFTEYYTRDLGRDFPSPPCGRVDERGSSFKDPFSSSRIERHAPLMIRYAVKRGRRIKVVKIGLRILRVNGMILETLLEQ